MPSLSQQYQVAIPLSVCVILCRAAAACLDATSLIQVGSTIDQPASHDVETQPFQADSDNILVYTNPKTGSGTLQYSLGRVMRPPCWISSSGWTRAMRAHATENAEYFLKQTPPGSHIWVISTSRNPLAREISEYFQGIHHRYSKEAVLNMSAEELHADFRRECYPDPPPPPQMWFKQHYIGLFGINVTEYPFDFEKKVLHFERTYEGDKKLSILIVRVEDSAQWDDILQPFFPGIRISKANFAAIKWYGSAYRKFVETFKFKESEIERLLRSEQMHFYSKDEITSFLELAGYKGDDPAEQDLFSTRHSEDSTEQPPPSLTLC